MSFLISHMIVHGLNVAGLRTGLNGAQDMVENLRQAAMEIDDFRSGVAGRDVPAPDVKSQRLPENMGRALASNLESRLSPTDAFDEVQTLIARLCDRVGRLFIWRINGQRS